MTEESKHHRIRYFPESLVVFNEEGYAIPPIERPYAGIVKNKKDDDYKFIYTKKEMITASNGNSYPMISIHETTRFTQPERAQALLSTLFSDPLYHSTAYYDYRIDHVRFHSSRYKAKTLRAYLDVAGSWLKRAEEIQSKIELGQVTFGCQKRFNLEGRTALETLNQLSPDVNHTYWKATKSVITYPDNTKSDVWKLKETKIDYDKAILPPTRNPLNPMDEGYNGYTWYKEKSLLDCLETYAIKEICNYRNSKLSSNTPNIIGARENIERVIWGLVIRKRLTEKEANDLYREVVDMGSNDIYAVINFFMEKYVALFPKPKVEPIDDFLNFLNCTSLDLIKH